MVTVGDLPQGGQIAGVAAQMDGDNSFGPGRNAAFHIGRVEVISAPAEVGEDRDTLLVNDANDRANVGDRRGDNFVTRPDPCRGYGDVQCGSAGGAWHHVLHRADLLEPLNEGSGLRPLPVKQGVLVESRVQSRALW